MKIGRRFEFCAAHHLPNHTGKCNHPHGHNYILEVEIEGNLLDGGSASGMVMDYADLKDCIEGVILDPLDHKMLNDIIPNPTTEKLIYWIVSTLKPLINHSSTRLSKVTLRESRDTWAIWEVQ